MAIIRQFREEDKEQVINLWNICKLIRSWNDPMKDIERKKGVGEDLFLVLEKDNKIIGSVMGGYDGHRGVMNYLSVHPEFRGKGFGKLLVNKVEEKLKELGCPKINLLVRSNNSKVIKFYEGNSYQLQSDFFLVGKRLISDE